MATATRPWAKEAPGKRQQQQVAFANIVRVLIADRRRRVKTLIAGVLIAGDRW